MRSDGSPLQIAVALDLDDAFDHAVARGIARYAARRPRWQLHGYGWMFRPLDPGTWCGHGAIARITGAADARRIAALGVPVVDVAGAVTGDGFSVVRNDDHLTGRWAGEHFAAAALGHAAFCGVSGVRWSADRLDGFVAGFGHPVRRRFLRPLRWWRRADAAGDLAAWLASLPAPCAILASHDVAALRVTQACAHGGLEVPGRIAVMGVDNEDVACELSTPPLASIPIDADRLGHLAAETLDARLAGAAVAPEHLVAPLPPLVRASAAIMRCADPVVTRALELIEAHAAEGWNVADLVAALPVGRRQLEQRFASALGTSPLRRLTLTRLRRAAQLLRGGGWDVAAAARASGYRDPRSLHAAMVRAWGCTPSQLRAGTATTAET